LQGVVLALIAFQDKQKKLHEEIDRVIGGERPPTWDDIPNLPYLLAFLEEVRQEPDVSEDLVSLLSLQCHRFRPVGPLGLPHEMVHDEWVDGMLLPKDSVVFMNMCKLHPVFFFQLS
jgi:cytochrome P450